MNFRSSAMLLLFSSADTSPAVAVTPSGSTFCTSAVHRGLRRTVGDVDRDAR